MLTNIASPCPPTLSEPTRTRFVIKYTGYVYHLRETLMYWLHKRLLSQNFLVNRELVKKLVRGSSISASDTVLEIGSGTGTITCELLQITPHVIPIEKDPKLTNHPQDFLTFSLPKTPYKVFSNIPYSITGAIVRKLLLASNPPQDCYLIMQSEAAAKFMIQPKANTMAAVLYYPIWDIRTIHHFARTDFSPIPAVDSVLVHFTPRSLVTNKSAYQDFIAHQFTHNKLAKFVSPTQYLKLFAHHDPRLSHGSFARLSRLQSLLPHHPRVTRY